ncbi:MAG: FISUMP domain-containing protein, partial [Bacteroidales bacterium]
MKKIKLYIIAVTILLFAFSGALSAQTSTIEGYVKDGSGRTPVTGINMYILDPAMTTTTDGSGYFSFTGITSGTSITVSCYVMGPSIPGSIRTFGVAPGTNVVNFWLNAVSDADGNSYSAAEIGSQIWMGENLKTTKYNNGTNIDYGWALDPNNNYWDLPTTPGYCWYDNDISNKVPQGALYNWLTVNTGDLCPNGWHVPTSDEWNSLKDYLSSIRQTYADGSNDVAKSIASTSGWEIPQPIQLPHGEIMPVQDGVVGKDQTSNNKTGFNGYPSGARSWADTFNDIGIMAIWWSATGPDNPWDFGIYNTSTDLFQGSDYKRNGFSVRCLSNLFKPTLTTAIISSPTINSAESGGDIINEGTATVTVHGVCWNTSHNPTISNSHTIVLGGGTGSFPGSLTGLIPNTTYYVRAYATNSVGTAYGDEISFTTLSCPTITATISGTTSICQNAASPNITFTGAGGTAPYTFNYRFNSSSGPTASVTTFEGNSVSVAAFPVPASTYTYYLVSAYDASGSSCSQAQSGSAVVTVNPVPVITAMTATVCSGAGFIVTPVNGTNGTVPVGTTYSWAAPTVTSGVTGGAAGSGSGNISGTLTNPTNVAQTATYTITPTSGSCTGGAFIVTVTVTPAPAITTMATSVCSGVVFTVTPVNNTNGIVPAGTTYDWAAPTITGGITGGASGSAAANISGTL